MLRPATNPKLTTDLAELGEHPRVSIIDQSWVRSGMHAGLGIVRSARPVYEKRSESPGTTVYWDVMVGDHPGDSLW